MKRWYTFSESIRQQGEYTCYFTVCLGGNHSVSLFSALQTPASINQCFGLICSSEEKCLISCQLSVNIGIYIRSFGRFMRDFCHFIKLWGSHGSVFWVQSSLHFNRHKHAVNQSFICQAISRKLKLRFKEYKIGFFLTWFYRSSLGNPKYSIHQLTFMSIT